MKNTRATPPVSIIVPCYNHGSSLPALLESIARQSLRGCEVRIVDDGSSEAIEPFIEPYRDAGNFTLNVMRQPARKGTLQARLAGILATRAPVIMFADADDQLYGGDALEFHYRLLLKERADIVHFRTLSADESRIEAVDRHARPLHALLVGERIFAAYCRTQRFNIWGKLYAREMCLRNMDFCLQDRKIWGHEDIWLSTWFFFNARRYVGSEKIGYVYHPHGDIWNFPSRIAARLITDRSMLEEMLPFFEQEGVQRRIANDCRRNMRKYLFESVAFLCARCFGEANGFFPQLFRLLTSGEDDVDILRAVECAAREATEKYGIFKDKLLEIREYLLGAPLGIRGEEEGALQHVPDTVEKWNPPIKEIFGKEAIDMNDRLTAVCFGAGSLARSVIPALDTDKVHIAAFVDERPGARGGVFSGRPVIDLPEMLLMNFDYVFIACRPVEAVSSRLLALGVSAKKIVSLDFESFLLAQQGFEPQDCQAALAAYLSSFPGLAGCFSLPTLLRSCGLSASLPRRGHTESKRFCPAPFTGASVEHDYDPAFADYKRGDVLLCCWAWFEDRAAFAGNITDYDSFMEVWNSERAQRFRASILDGSFKYCNREMCSSLKYAALPFADDVVEPALRKIIDAQSVAVPAPQEIRLNYDLSCNLACPQCRRERVMAKGRELGTIREFHDRVVASLDNPKRLVLTNGGDALASPVFLPFLQNFDVTRFPETKITLRTNGILFTPKIWESLRPAHAHIDEVNISVDAASEETYKKVRKPGGFPTLLKNLGFIQQIRKESAPFKLVLNFCIQKANYTEMGDFVSLGERYGADGVMFGVLAPNGEYMGAAYGENAVHIETHPEHGEYLKKLADPRLGHPAVSLPVTKRQWRELRAQEALVPEVSERPAVSVLWFGTGSMTQELLPAVRRESVRIPAFIDEREHMRGAIFHGAPVLGLEQAASHLCDYVLVGARPFALIADKLKKAGIPEDKIVNLDFESFVRESRPSSHHAFEHRFNIFIQKNHLEAYLDILKIQRTGWYKTAVQNYASRYTNSRKDDGVLTCKITSRGGYGDILITSAVIKELYKNIDIKTNIDVYTRYPEIFSGHRYIRNAYKIDPVNHDKYDITFEIFHFIVLQSCSISLQSEKFSKLRSMIHKFSEFADTYKRYGMHNTHCYDGTWARLCVLMGWNRWDQFGASGAFPFSRENRAFVRIEPDAYAVLRAHGLDVARYCTVHAGIDARFASNQAPKVWPKDRWREFCRIFKRRHPDIALVQVGVAHSPVIEGADLCLLGKTSMEETKTILKHALAHVDGESGLVHLRRQLGGASVVLFGPTPEAYYGYPQNKNIVAETCGDCTWLTDDWYMRCIRGLDIPECMQSIRPQKVLRAVEEILGDRKEYTYAVSDAAVYSSSGMAAYEKPFLEFCRFCGLERKPVSEHIFGECGIVVHASKQWEYPYAVSMLRDNGSRLKIADVGSGRGALSLYLARQGHDVTAYDLDFASLDVSGGGSEAAAYIRFAEEQGFTAEYGDIYNLPAEDETFDVVVCISVVEHVPQKYYALKEMLRVLKPGGRLVLTYDLVTEHADVVHGEDSARRLEVFTPEHITALLREFGMEAGEVHDKASLCRSLTDIQTDKVRGIPEGLTVGGLVLTKTRKAVSPREETP